MKNTLYIWLFLLAARPGFAQNNRDSLLIRNGNNWICIGISDYRQPYDSIYNSLSRRIRSLLPATANSFPPDIRYIRGSNGAEFLRFYHEPEPETENWTLQVERMQNSFGPPAIYTWKCRMADHASGMLFTLYASDSTAMRNLLLTDLQLNQSVRAARIEALRSPKEDPWLVQMDETGGDLLVQARKRRLEHYGVRAFTGPALFGDQLAVGFGGELNRVFFKNQREVFRFGLSSATYFSNFTGETGRWNSMTMVQLKFVKPRSEDKPWFGIKLGVGGLETGANPLFQWNPAQVVQLSPSGPIMPRLPFWSVGFSLENTPLADFDIDFLTITQRHIIKDSRQGVPIMLSVKLPF
ncbi:MAG: hypothetical protein ACK5XN_24760 [Bacteroidota bacterium]|jgi:hypothetical protein